MQNFGALLLVTNPKIGTTYIVKKEWQNTSLPNNPHIIIFIGRLVKIKRHDTITYLGAHVHNFYFEEAIQLYHDGKFCCYTEGVNGPFTVYEPDDRHPGILFSAKFFRRLPMLPGLKQQIQGYHFRKVIPEFERKTGIPEAVLTNVLIGFI